MSKKGDISANGLKILADVVISTIHGIYGKPGTAKRKKNQKAFDDYLDKIAETALNELFLEQLKKRFKLVRVQRVLKYKDKGVPHTLVYSDYVMPTRSK